MGTVANSYQPMLLDGIAENNGSIDGNTSKVPAPLYTVEEPREENTDAHRLQIVPLNNHTDLPLVHLPPPSPLTPKWLMFDDSFSPSWEIPTTATDNAEYVALTTMVV